MKIARMLGLQMAAMALLAGGHHTHDGAAAWPAEQKPKATRAERRMQIKQARAMAKKSRKGRGGRKC